MPILELISDQPWPGNNLTQINPKFRASKPHYIVFSGD